MKKVIICDNAGYANYTHKLCNAAAEKINDWEIIYLTDSNNTYISEVNPRVKVITDVPCYNPLCKRGSLSWLTDRISLPFRILRKRNKIIKKSGADSVCLQAYMPVFDQFILRSLQKEMHVVLTVHNVIPHEKNILWSNRSLKRVYQNAEHLIVHTEKNRDELKALFGITTDKISVINHGTDLDYTEVSRSECNQKLDITDSKPTFLLYGGIREYKGLDVLLDAAKGLDCRLIIAGALSNGITFENYQKQIDKNKLDVKCFIEFVSEEFTNVLFQACDFVVFPYKEFHSQSGVFMQAIKYQKKVVATDVGAFKDFIDKYDLGYVCAPNSVEELHECMKTAIDNIATKTNGTDIRTYFSWETSANQYFEVFNELSKQY